MPAVLNLLRIKNLALVEDLQWELEPGFTAITGETGAGKSIIIGALQLLLGERADKSLIRTGADTCTVEAVFEGEELERLNTALEAAGVEGCTGELILRRTLSTTGANRQFINGSPTTLAVLKSLGDDLVDLHGPHDHQSLLSPERQLGLLDAFARHQVGPETGQSLSLPWIDYHRHYEQLRGIKEEHASLSTSEAARQHELDLLRHQVNEITSAKLEPDEEEQIEARYKLASNSKRLIELAGGIALRLAEGDEAIITQLGETQKLLRELEKIDPEMAALSDAHAASVTELAEIARTLSRYAERLDLDPQQLATLEQRVTLFETLKRKYGGSVADVIAFGEAAEARLRKIEGRDEELARLTSEMKAVEAQMNRAAAALRKMRAEAAPKLSETVRRHLRDLGFKQAEFEAKLTPLAEPRASDPGQDGEALLNRDSRVVGAGQPHVPDVDLVTDQVEIRGQCRRSCRGDGEPLQR